MSDKITKFLRKLPRRENARADEVIARIKMNDLLGLNIKSLSGYNGWFRCRVGRVRIIFEKIDETHNVIRKVDWRDDKTYKNL